MAKILAVRSIGFHETYDLEVEHENHQFRLANGILTSNSHAVSYAMVSYWCAWMLTYHPDEWICAWCESMSTNSEDRAVAFRTVRQWGGEIRSIDARYATDKWRIIEPGVYMPALSAASGVGTTALRELIKFRPFNSMRDLLYGNGEVYRLSKLNKKALESLIRIGAFNCFVGSDKEFSSVNHMLEVVIKGGDALRKTLKRNPAKGRDTYDEWLVTKRDVAPRTREQRIKDQQEILGMVDPNLILTRRVREFFVEHEIPCIDDVTEEEAALCWFVVGSATAKKTKAGKPYLQLQALDASMGEYRINVWSFTGKKGDIPKPWSLIVGKLRQDEWGWKGFWDGLKILDSSKFEERE